MLVDAEVQGEICTAAAKLHKEVVGRGPTSITLEVTGNVFALTFFNFLTPIERSVLHNTNNQCLVRRFREALLGSTQEDWRKIFEECGFHVSGISGSIDFEQEKRVLRIVVK